MVGKAKSVKSKNETSEHNGDDRLGFHKEAVLKPTKEKVKEKLKEKHRRKGSLKKKLAGAHSFDLPIEEHHSTSDKKSQNHSKRHSDNHHHHHSLTEKRISRACEESVDEAITDFFECAWKAIAERFSVVSAPITVSFELRNTWLRIIEAEYQDSALKENVQSINKHNKVFNKDDPPLPLAFDSWSRGVLETVPQVRQESVLDPFIRDIDPAVARLIFRYSLEGEYDGSLLGDGSFEQGIGEAENGLLELETEVSTEEDKDTTSVKDIDENEQWSFDLDQKYSFHSGLETDSAVTNDANKSETEISSTQPNLGEPEKPLYSIFPPRALNLDESTTERNDLSSPASTNAKKNSEKFVLHKSKAMKRFSPSQCGGQTGSGAFRLPFEPTFESLVRMKGKEPLIQPQDNESLLGSNQDNANEREVQVINEIQIMENANVHGNELTVQPLFSEPRSTQFFSHENLDKNSENQWGRRPFPEQSLNMVASDVNTKFLKRRLVNLHGHFKRQTRRALAALAKKREATLVRHLTSPITSVSGTSSTLSRSSDGTNSEKRGHERTDSIQSKSSQSVSNFNVARGERGHHSGHHHSGHHVKTPATHSKGKKSQKRNSRDENSPVRNSQVKNSLVKNSRDKNSLVKNSQDKNSLVKNSRDKTSLVANSWDENSRSKKGRDTKPPVMNTRVTNAMPDPQQGQRQKQPLKIGSKEKNIKSNWKKPLANVRPVHRAEFRSLAGKYHETNYTTAQLQCRLENSKKFSRIKCRSSRKLFNTTPSDCGTLYSCPRTESPC